MEVFYSNKIIFLFDVVFLEPNFVFFIILSIQELFVLNSFEYIYGTYPLQRTYIIDLNQYRVALI